MTPTKSLLKKIKSKLSAFSLIELSFVILIIGFLVAAIILGKNLVSRSRITNAQTLTQSSPAFAISDLRLWLETSLDRSFKADEMVDDTKITLWNDINPTSRTAVTPVTPGAANNPTYSTTYTINSIPTVHFKGSTTDYLTINDASFLNNTDYTICITEKRGSNAANNYFIGNGSVATGLLLGYRTDGTVVHSHAGNTAPAANGNAYSYGVPTFADSSKPKLFCFVQDSTKGKTIYINGIKMVLVNNDPVSSTNPSQLSGITSLEIGRGYTGEISDIMIFTKALSITQIESITNSFFANLFISEAKADINNSEIQDIMKYMSKKVTVPIAAAGTSCNGGTVKEATCIPAPSCNVTGITGINNTTVSYAGIPTTLNCNANYYSTADSISYTCINGTFTKTSGACNTCSASGAWYLGQCVIGYPYGGHNYAYVGQYAAGGQGPSGASSPPTYTCQEACAIVFGGSAGSYVCSRNNSSIDRGAWLVNWGSTSSNFGADTYKNCSTYNALGCITAYVADRYWGQNHCFFY